MADHVITKAQAILLWHDNNIGNISAEDGRDFILSTYGFIFNRPPGPNDDSNGTSGLGNFFDNGNRWFDQPNNRFWFCVTGQPGLAIWQAMMFDGQPAGGRLSGLFPNPHLTPSGVVPGVYGDATHWPVITISLDGTISVAAQQVISLPPTGVVPGNYGDATHYPTFTVQADGRLTVAGQLPLPGGGGGTVTSVGLSMPPGWAVAGSPVTNAGTFVVMSPLTTVGDILVRGPTDTRQPVGVIRQILTPDPLSPTGLSWTYFGLPGKPNGNPSGGQYMFDANGPGGARCWYVAGTAYHSNPLGTGGPGMSEDGILFAYPFQSPGGRIDKLAIWVTSGDAGGVAYRIRLGIYSAGTQTAPYPQNLFVDLGEIIVPDTSGAQLYETPGGGGFITVPGQLYWLVGIGTFGGTPHSISCATLFGVPSALNVLGFVGDATPWNGGSPGIGWSFGSAYGPLPDPFPGDPSTATPITNAVDTFPAIGMHFQS